MFINDAVSKVVIFVQKKTDDIFFSAYSLENVIILRVDVLVDYGARLDVELSLK